MLTRKAANKHCLQAKSIVKNVVDKNPPMGANMNKTEEKQDLHKCKAVPPKCTLINQKEKDST